MKKNKITLIILALLIILLRLPSLFEPNRYADEDIYLTLGLGLKRGLVFYRDIHDNKPPLLYIIAAIAGNVPVFRLILLFWNLVNVYFIHLLSQKLFKKPSLRLISVFLFAILSCLPLTEGNIANGEIFMIMPTTVAVFLLLSKSKHFLAGLLLAVAFLFKIPVVFEFIAIIFWLTFYCQKNLIKGFKKIFSLPVISTIMGFTLPIAATIIYYHSVSAGQPYVRAALLQNIGYLSSWQGGKQPFYQSGLFIRAALLAAIILPLYIYRHRLDQKFGLIACWFTGALFGALLSGRPYPHYFIQVLPPAVFLITYPFVKKSHLTTIFSLLLLLFTFSSLYYYKFWHYKSLPYYKNFVQYSLGQIDKQTFYRFWGDSVITNYQIAQYVQGCTTTDQPIFVWGTQPAIYTISQRLPVGRYTVAYHISDFHAHDETMEKLQSTLPKFIIYFPDNPPFEALNQFIKDNYSIDKIFSPAIIFQLNQ